MEQSIGMLYWFLQLTMAFCYMEFLHHYMFFLWDLYGCMLIADNSAFEDKFCVHSYSVLYIHRRSWRIWFRYLHILLLLFIYDHISCHLNFWSPSRHWFHQVTCLLISLDTSTWHIRFHFLCLFIWLMMATRSKHWLISLNY
jgi:hypothetical protein